MSEAGVLSTCHNELLVVMVALLTHTLSGRRPLTVFYRNLSLLASFSAETRGIKSLPPTVLLLVVFVSNLLRLLRRLLA